MTMAVGLIVHAEQAEGILQEGRAIWSRSRARCSIARTGPWMPRRNWLRSEVPAGAAALPLLARAPRGHAAGGAAFDVRPGK